MYQGTPTLCLDGMSSFYSCQWMSSDPAKVDFLAEGCVRAFGEAGVQQAPYGRRFIAQHFYPFVNYHMLEDIIARANPRRQHLLGLHGTGAYS